MVTDKIVCFYVMVDYDNFFSRCICRCEFYQDALSIKENLEIAYKREGVNFDKFRIERCEKDFSLSAE